MSQQRSTAVCQVCDKTKSRYKCPNCSIPYCSLDCFKNHKEKNLQNQISLCEIINENLVIQKNKKYIAQIGIEQQNEQPQVIKTDYVQDQSLRLTQMQLQKLRKNEKLIKMLQNKDIRQKISQIDNSRMRLNLLQQALLNKQFMDFADEALRTVGKLNNQ